MTIISVPCSRCGSIPPIGASLSYLGGWGYCPLCFPKSADPAPTAFPLAGRPEDLAEIANLRAEVRRLRKALADYLAGRQDSRGNPTPAGPKCQKCGGPEHGAMEVCPAPEFVDPPPKCETCEGSGTVWFPQTDTSAPCPACRGTGRRA